MVILPFSQAMLEIGHPATGQVTNMDFPATTFIGSIFWTNGAPLILSIAAWLTVPTLDDARHSYFPPYYNKAMKIINDGSNNL